MYKITKLYPKTAVVLVAAGMIISAPLAQAAPSLNCAAQWKTMQVSKAVPTDITEAVFLKNCKTKEASTKKKPMIMKEKDAVEPADSVAAKPEAKPETAAMKAETPKVKKAKKKMAPAPIEAAKTEVAQATAQAEKDPAVVPKADAKTMAEAKPSAKVKKPKKTAVPAEAEKSAAIAKPEAPAAASNMKSAAMKKPAKKVMEPVAKAVEKPMDEKAMQQARITECGNQWKTMKVANKVPTGVTWPKFWLECSDKMKAAGK
jgi:hypothetical protein